MVSCMVITILRFIKAERTYKLALASDISALAITIDAAFFSYWTDLKLTPLAATIRHFLLCQLTQQ